MKKATLVKGMRDVFPDYLKKFNFVVSLIDEVSETYGYQKMKTPLLEKSQLFKDDKKWNYVFANVDDEVVCLKSNSNIPIIRSIIDNKLYLDPFLPLKFSSCDDCFAYYRPSNIKKRQFEQYDFECFGVKSPYLDAEIILMATRILNFLGIDKIEVKIKSLSSDKNHFKSINSMLYNLKINYIVDEQLKNENNEFSEFMFEITAKIGRKSFKVISGGGHDKIAAQLSNQSFSSRGFSIYLDEIIDILENLKLFPSMNDELDFYVSTRNNRSCLYAGFVSLYLRDLGLKVETNYHNINRTDAIKKAISLKIPYFIIVKDDFDLNEQVEIINLYNNKKTFVKLENLLQELEYLGTSIKHKEENE